MSGFPRHQMQIRKEVLLEKKLHFLNIFSCEVLSILKTYVILVVISNMLLKDVKIYYDRFLSDLCPLLNAQNEFDWPSKFLTPCHICLFYVTLYACC